jgi:hypothetical protein
MIQPTVNKKEEDQQQQDDEQQKGSSSFDLQQQPSRAKAKKNKKKYVTLKVLTTLHQQDLNQLIEHLRQLQDFHFMVKSKVLYPLEIKKEDKERSK